MEPFAFDIMKKIHFQKSFAMLKSSCDPVALNPDKKSCLSLIDVLNKLNPDILEQFQDYICFPVFLHLKNGQIEKNETKRFLLEILLIIWSKISIDDSNLFWRNFCLILDQLEDSKNGTSEEMQLVILKCIKTLLKRSSRSVLNEVYSREHYPRISIAIFTCIQSAKNEKSSAIKLEALESLLTFVTGYNKFPDLKEKVAHIVMLMVPGLMSVCLEVVTASDVQNHKLNLLAVQLWGRTIGLVMEDRIQNKVKVFKINRDENSHKQSNTGDMKSMLMNQKRDEEWLKSSAEKLARIISVMLRQAQHNNYKVRKQLAVEIDFILTHASCSMLSSLNYLLDTLIILSQDEHPEVSKVSGETIKRFSSKCDAKKQRKLVEVIEECFYSLLTKLPRIFHGVDLDEKENHLRLLGGYLDILGMDHVPKITKSAQHLSRLLKSLQIAATLECNVVSLLEEISIREVDEESTINDSVWKQFKYSNTPKFQTILKSVCQKLASYADVSVITHSLLDELISNRNKKETILVLNFMLSSENPRFFSNKESVLRTVLVTIMEPLVDGKLPFMVGKDGAETRSEAQSNVIEICLISECVATIAVALGGSAFTPLLLRCLYPLLETAGSPIFALSVAGLKSVNRIANLYGGGVGDLVSQNVDYLSHHVTVNLKNVEKNPKVLSVLSVIMKHSSMEVLPSLYNIVNDVLVQSCDIFQEGNISAFIHVFHTFVSCLLSWLDIKSDTKKEISIKKSVYEELLEYHQAKLDSNSWKEPEESVPDVNEEEIEENVKTEEKPESPDHIKFTIQILKRSLNFLPSKDISVQIVVLQILEKGILILSPYQNDLLPITYKIWSPLVARFHHRNTCLIINRAFSLLTTLGNTSKDFVRQQTLKDVLPSLCKSLIINAENSKNKLSTSSYVLSQPYKLQFALLKGIGELCVDMDVTGSQLESVLDALDPYLGKSQPKTLQDLCISSYLAIAQKESNTVWVHLISRTSADIEFNGPYMRSYKIQGATVFNDYQDNINFLLKQI